MSRRILCALLIAACGGDDGSPAQLVGAGAVLSSVSYDGATVASYAGAERQSNGAYLGGLQVSPVGGGAARTLDARAAAATFARGTTLYYLAGASLVTEGTPPRPRAYGTLTAWLPSQPQPVTLGAVVGAFSVSQDGSAVAFIDRTAASASAPGAVKVWSTALCAASCAPPITVADGVASAGLSLAVDGKHVLVDVPKSAGAPASVALVSFPAGTATTLSTTTGTNPRSAMLSADGATAAWLEGANDLLVASTATAAAAPTTLVLRTATSDSPTVQSAQMQSPSTFVARIKIGNGDPALYTVAGGSVTPLGITSPVRYSVVQTTPGGSTAASRWLFYATVQDAATGAEDLWLLDLAQPATPPKKLADATAGNPSFSDDASTLRFLDAEDLDAATGDLYVASLPAGARTLVASGVRQAAFEPGTRTLVYVAEPDAATGAGTLTRFDLGSAAAGKTIAGVINFSQSRAAPVFYYTSPDGIFRTGMP